MGNLTAKQARFVAAYQISNDSTKSAIDAGYSAKFASVEGCRLLRHPKVVAEIEAWKKEKRERLTKEDFIGKAMEVYEVLEVTEPNKPRFLDIAGKALGYIGAQNDAKPSQTLQLTQININGSENQGQLWEMTRKLLGND
jgi:hypothetical protein